MSSLLPVVWPAPSEPHGVNQRGSIMVAKTGPTRRDLIAMGGAAVLSTSFASGSTLGSELVQGLVFHDRSQSGRRNPGDPGIPGVLVSNGLDVVVTNRDGIWRLPLVPGDQVFIVKPPQWATPRRENGAPLVSHRYTGVAGEVLDFPLTAIEEPAQFEALLVTDTQPQTPRELDYLRDSILIAAANSRAAFAINHGDVVFDDLALYPRYLDLVRMTGMPWHHCPGNHDMDRQAHRADQCFSTWQGVFGPTYYAFQYAGATFILLNNVEPVFAAPDFTSHGYRGLIGARQLTFVRNLLAQIPSEHLVVVSMHIPLVGFDDPSDPAGTTLDRHALLALLSGRRNTLTLAGHTHTTEHHYLGASEGFSGPGLHHHHVLTAACGSWWSGPYDAAGLPVAGSRDGTPKGFHVLSVDGNTYSTRFVPVGHIGDTRMRISIEGARDPSDSMDDGRAARERLSPVLGVDQLEGATLVVNVFDGGPRTKVACQVIGADGARRANLHPPIAMQRRSVCDPFTVEAFCRHKSELKPWVEPSVASHIWTAPLPRSLCAGSYRLLVTVDDEYGDRFSSNMLLEVVG
jgi:C terminal of Calcineurin-like phosphoesterase/Calcineurin-like phosphoesterase